jgi:ABC-type nitrate/sulfonate/bicarbonate transport system ATPase subunit
MFSHSKILLLDDVISSVDAHTANHILKNCLRGPLSFNRTIILVSSAVDQCLGISDYVVVLDAGGRMCAAGPVETILARYRSDSRDDIKLKQV